LRSAVQAVEKRLKYQFRDPQLLECALTHRSAGKRNNERLEFLGDSILNLVIAEFLFRHLTDAPEGDLSRMRASLVKGEKLAKLATGLELGEYLVLGSGELKSGGFRRSSILADSLEAIFGAIFMDAGFEACQRIILEIYAATLDDLPDVSSIKDPKTKLQEFLQSRQLPLPEYEVLSVEGEPHAQKFVVVCRVSGMTESVQGNGSSRKKAEQSAAKKALQELLHD
jgi:ribonuclease-3